MSINSILLKAMALKHLYFLQFLHSRYKYLDKSLLSYILYSNEAE